MKWEFQTISAARLTWPSCAAVINDDKLFAYGRHHFDEDRCEAALDLLEHLKPEQNFITRSWAKAGIKAENAADSQALICLKKNYCDTKDCLRCRFGAEYLRQR